MYKPFRTAAVLGAGVMGGQLAAHLANAGLKVHLLDIPARKANQNAQVEANFKKLLQLKPEPFFSKKTRDLITLGNFAEHLPRLAEVDWVIEAVVENLEIKQKLMAEVANVVRKNAVISTNTIGLSIAQIAQGRSESFRRRFLGTHFFNPPRYKKLLELIPTVDTDEEVTKRVEWFARVHLGKEVVLAKDTPEFIGNRIGFYTEMPSILRALSEDNYTIEEIDFLTGPLVGRPKSATFGTADQMGLDEMIHILDSLYRAIPQDERRERFKTPNILRKLVAKGALGDKVGRGFYKQEGEEILSVNPQTLKYEPLKPLNLGNLDRIVKIADLGDRLRALYHKSGRAGNFFRQNILEILSYCSRRIPEIADSPAQIDQAMRWGFNWELGPFQIWDALGFEKVLADLKQAGYVVPYWIEKMEKSGATSFYRGGEEVYDPVAHTYKSHYQPQDEISLAGLESSPKRVLWWENPDAALLDLGVSEAALLDLGDGVALYEFRSPGNVLNAQVIEGLFKAIDVVEEGDFLGLVIGNDGENFSTGLNMEDPQLPALMAQLQELGQLIHHASKPIVAALQGKVLGGGYELAMACHQIVAAAESYIGLVELGLGLIPGGGGLMRLTAAAAEQAAQETYEDILPFLEQAFETVLKVKVSSSAMEAQEMGLLPPNTQIVMNAYRRFYVAKKEVIRLEEEGFVPPPINSQITVLGRNGRKRLEYCAQQLLQQKVITEYDYSLAKDLAYVITGGDLPTPTQVDEDYLLKLEQETLSSLLNEEKTRERIA